jgi:hypothetical protein
MRRTELGPNALFQVWYDASNFTSLRYLYVESDDETKENEPEPGKPALWINIRTEFGWTSSFHFLISYFILIKMYLVYLSVTVT